MVGRTHWTRLAVAVLLVGCRVEVALPATAILACQLDEHCPGERVCLVEPGTDGRCVAAGTACMSDAGDHHAPALTTPSDLAAALRDGGIELTWSSDPATQSLVERRDLSSDWREVTRTAAGAASFRDGEFISLDGRYEYRVRSASGDCRSAPSAEVRIFSEPRRPSELTAEATGPTQIELRWLDTNSLESGYALERREASATEFVPIAPGLAADSESYLDQELAPESTYEYRLLALNQDGAASEAATVTGWTMPELLVSNAVLLDEDFEQQPLGQPPADWIEHPASEGLYCETPTDFSTGHPFTVELVDLQQALTTTYQNGGCVNAYHAGDEAEPWSSYLFSGRMRADRGNVGVSFHTQQPELQRHGLLLADSGSAFGDSFRLRLNGASTYQGRTEVTPEIGAWYRFEVLALTGAESNVVRARVWPEVMARPADWQSRLTDHRLVRLTQGAVGVFASHYVSAWWDDLRVVEARAVLDLAADEVVEGAPAKVVLQLSAPMREDVAVDWATRDGTATGGEDFVAAAGTIVIPSGLTRVEVDLETVDDASAEPPEIVFFEASTDALVPVLTPVLPVVIRDSDGSDLWYAEQFAYPSGPSAPGWTDYEANFSARTNDEVFRVTSYPPGNGVLWRPSSEGVNEISYLSGFGSDRWSDYELSARIYFTSIDSGAGLAILAQSPFETHSTYRFRRYFERRDFHVVKPDGTNCDAAVPVPAEANAWHQIVFRVEDTGTATRLRAKSWLQGASEPAGWQIDCTDSGPNRLRQGTIGAWAMGDGDVYWDDLVVKPIP